VYFQRLWQVRVLSDHASTPRKRRARQFLYLLGTVATCTAAWFLPLYQIAFASPGRKLPLPPLIAAVTPFGGPAKATLRGVMCVTKSNATTSLREISWCEPRVLMYLPALNITARPFSTGFPVEPACSEKPRTEWFAVDYNGKFTVKKGGAYKFRLVSDDGSLLWIDWKQVIDNDGVHSVTSKAAVVHLEPGEHKVRVFYFQARSWVALQLFVTPPGDKEILWRSEF